MGGQKNIAIFCKYLGEQNELTGVSVKENDAAHAVNYELISLFSNSRLRYLNPFYLKHIKKIIQKRKVKNVITEHPYMAWMAWLLKKQINFKWFVHSHNIEYERFRTLGKWWFPLMRLYENWVYSSADTVFFITPEDISFAINNSMVKSENAFLVPYGTELQEMPNDILQQKENIFRLYDIPSSYSLIFFNGNLSYKPNADALKFILDKINPILLQQTSFNYRILVCGKDLPASFDQLKNYYDKNILYTGFVDDVVPYFKAADIFLNPIIAGGGIKTKIVEAMFYGNTVISCKTGSAGINLSVCGEKIKIVPDNDENAFASAILETAARRVSTPAGYYEYYYWGNIVRRLGSVFEN